MDQLSRIECLRPVLNSKQPFHGLCLDEGAPHSVVGLLQWFAYLKQIHLPDSHFTVHPTTSDVFFGGNDGNKVSASMLGVVIIRVPITDKCYFDYSSFLVENNIPMLLGLSTQQRLQAVTTKSADENKMQLRAIGVTLQLTFKKNHLYYEFGNTPLYLFSFAELVYEWAGGYISDFNLTNKNRVKAVSAECNELVISYHNKETKQLWRTENITWVFDVSDEYNYYLYIYPSERGSPLCAEGGDSIFLKAMVICHKGS